MFKLTSGNMDSLYKKIPIKELTKTFVDALMVTQALGLQYIWIDSLCIIQDDNDDVGSTKFILKYSLLSQ